MRFVRPLYKITRKNKRNTLDGPDLQFKLKKSTNINIKSIYVKPKFDEDNDMIRCDGDKVLVSDGYRGVNNGGTMSDNIGSSKNVTEVRPRVSVPTSVTWLRLYPASKRDDESIFSVAMRCILCQLGLISFLVLWTLIWVALIWHIEAPYEYEQSENFKTVQNQLVIDLATELRQITPVSPKWREAIERRLIIEREQTLLAVGRGARLQPGIFWNLSGTFLFSIYVMTALGFGAPVPNTSMGRSAALMYACLSVPIHLYLLVQVSTSFAVKYEHLSLRWKPLKKKSKLDVTDEEKTPSEETLLLRKFGNKVSKFLTCLTIAHGIPLLAVTYYLFGAITFGICRGRTGLDVVMFSLEFTTSGGLELVEEYARFLYALYVEGAMIALSCALAILRMHSGTRFQEYVRRHRLYYVHRFHRISSSSN